jgi:hypothetical protein
VGLKKVSQFGKSLSKHFVSIFVDIELCSEWCRSQSVNLKNGPSDNKCKFDFGIYTAPLLA